MARGVRLDCVTLPCWVPEWTGCVDGNVPLDLVCDAAAQGQLQCSISPKAEARDLTSAELRESAMVLQVHLRRGNGRRIRTFLGVSVRMPNVVGAQAGPCMASSVGLPGRSAPCCVGRLLAAHLRGNLAALRCGHVGKGA